MAKSEKVFHGTIFIRGERFCGPLTLAQIRELRGWVKVNQEKLRRDKESRRQERFEHRRVVTDSATTTGRVVRPKNSVPRWTSWHREPGIKVQVRTLDKEIGEMRKAGEL